MSDGASQAYSDQCELKKIAKEKYGSLNKDELGNLIDHFVKEIDFKRQQIRLLEKELYPLEYEYEKIMSLFIDKINNRNY